MTDKMSEKDLADKEEEWNENVETCSDCGIQWKKIGKQCPSCYAPAEKKRAEKDLELVGNLIGKVIDSWILKFDPNKSYQKELSQALIKWHKQEEVKLLESLMEQDKKTYISDYAKEFDLLNSKIQQEIDRIKEK